MARETRLLAGAQADLALKASALAARISDLADRQAAELEAVTAERDRLALDLRAEAVKSAALEKRLEAVGKSASPAEVIVAERDRYQRERDQARDETDLMRNLYEEKCKEADALLGERNDLSAQLGGGCGVDAEIDKLQKELMEAEGARDKAVAGEREALTDLGKVRSCFEAQRKALCDRLGLDASATWADITVRVR